MTTAESSSRGPLTGLKVLEFVGIGPGPHCAMLFADLGADVLRIDRAGGNGWPNPIMDRGRATKVVDIRSDEGRAWCRDAAAMADVVIEGSRPGVMERLGLGPDDLLAINPGLVYGRITGWGQEGTLARSAGHDINYIGLTGVLAAMGRPGEPAPVPLNLVGDFGGGSMLLAFGILAALWERDRSGKGQVVDAAIVDGVASMMSMFTGLAATGRMPITRERNPLAGAAPFYRCYLCSDGREVALGPLEPQFFAAFLGKLGLEALAPAQNDETRWVEMTGQFAKVFAQHDRDHWTQLFEGSDACLTSVLTTDEAPLHPHHVSRATFVEHDGINQVQPVPRFSRTAGQIQSPRDADALLRLWASGQALPPAR